MAEAIALHEETLKLTEAKLGPDHPDTLVSRNNLAVAYRAAGRTAEAIALHEATLKLREAKLGPRPPRHAHSRNNLAAPTSRSAAGPRPSRCVATPGPPPQGRRSPTAPSWPATSPSSARTC